MPSPKAAYDVVIVGGGGHGLATAHYLAKEHGITNVAVLEKNWIGSGNAGRNTTIIRSNYLLPGNERFYEWSMKLWEGLEQDLNYNAMVSQRGMLNIYHSDVQRDAFARRGNSMRLHGAGGELLDRERVARSCCLISTTRMRDFRFTARLLQPRGGTARHDAVVWGYARAASERGVDIVQNCEVTGITIENGRAIGVETIARRHPRQEDRDRRRRQQLAARRHGRAAAADRKPCAASLRHRGHQAARSTTSSPSAPDISISARATRAGLSSAAISTAIIRYAQRGNLPTVEDVCEGGMALMPVIGRLRILRSWGGIVDMSMDGSPIIDRTRRSRASISMPAGAMAASRRRPARAGALPI